MQQIVSAWLANSLFLSEKIKNIDLIIALLIV
jgi:hypothetical protein